MNKWSIKTTGNGIYEIPRYPSSAAEDGNIGWEFSSEVPSPPNPPCVPLEPPGRTGHPEPPRTPPNGAPEPPIPWAEVLAKFDVEDSEVPARLTPTSLLESEENSCFETITCFSKHTCLKGFSSLIQELLKRFTTGRFNPLSEKKCGELDVL